VAAARGSDEGKERAQQIGRVNGLLGLGFLFIYGIFYQTDRWGLGYPWSLHGANLPPSPPRQHIGYPPRYPHGANLPPIPGS
jgi:hypothetical protein